MKIFSTNYVRNALAVVIVGSLASLAYIVDPAFLKTPKVEAGSGGSVAGYAWSETIGWISFSCTNDGSCGSSPYGVSVSAATGDFSGFAWSENIGWIKFAPTSGYPSQPNHGARLEASNTVTGWARACAGTVNGDCASPSRTDGWDGWIKLSKDPSDAGASYGIILNPTTGNFSSFAWGSDVVGWIDFAPIAAGANAVHLPPLATPTFNFYSDAASVINNGTTVIQWNNIANSTSCIPSSGSTGWSSVTTGIGGGSWTTGILTTAGSPYSYGLTCTGSGGSVPKVVNITVTAPTCDNDNVCELGETISSCPNDCKTKVQQF